MSRIIHFEIGAEDPERACKFYNAVFGWQVNRWDGPMPYWLLATGDKATPGIDGAIMHRTPTLKHTINYAQVASVDESLAKVLANGGKEVEPKMEVPGVGFTAQCEDTEGNLIGLFQPLSPCPGAGA